MKRVVQIAGGFSTVSAFLFLTLMAQQAVAPTAAKTQAAAPQQSLAQKQYSAILKEQNPAKLASDLEQFIRNNPEYPNLSSAYSSLLMALARSNVKKALTLSDEVLARYSDPNAAVRYTAYSVKFMVLGPKKKDQVSKLGLKILETETSPALLRMAAESDLEHSLKLYEKAMQERAKNPSPTAQPTMVNLRWDYALRLERAGLKDEALKNALEVIEAAKKNIAELEALPKGDPKRRTLDSLHETMTGRFETLADLYSDLKDYQQALDCLDLAEQNKNDNTLQGRSYICGRRADLYTKMGKPDLAFENYAQTYAASMDRVTRDKIIDLAKKNGKQPGEIFARARQIRGQGAVPIKEFELKTVEGPAATLGSLKSKVTLVNFFYPT